MYGTGGGVVGGVGGWAAKGKLYCPLGHMQVLVIVFNK